MEQEQTPSTPYAEGDDDSREVMGDHPIVAELHRRLAILTHDELLVLRSIHGKLDGLGPPRSRAAGRTRPRGGALLG